MPDKQGKLLACVGTRVQIFAWSGTGSSDPPELTLLCGASGQVASVYAATRGDAVVVGACAMLHAKPPGMCSSTAVVIIINIIRVGVYKITHP